MWKVYYASNGAAIHYLRNVNTSDLIIYNENTKEISAETQVGNFVLISINNFTTLTGVSPLMIEHSSSLLGVSKSNNTSSV